MSVEPIEPAAPALLAQLETLAGNLTSNEDREAYANLISYLRSLPADDEILRLAQLLGVVTLAAEEIPSAARELGESLKELLRQSEEFHEAVSEKLQALPEAIEAELDIDAFAKRFGESFRQQIAGESLVHTLALLRFTVDTVNGGVRDMQKASNSFSLQVTAMRSRQQQIVDSAAQLERVNADIATRVENAITISHALALLCVFLLGLLAGHVMK